MGPVDHVFIHHFVSPEFDDLDASLMRTLERNAMAAQPGVLSCMPYHMVLSGNGDVYWGRAWGAKGGATLNWNSNSYAICFLGNFENDEPNEVAIRSAAKEMSWGLHGGFITPNFVTVPHRRVYPTACPGANLVPRAGDLFWQIGGMARAYRENGILGATDAREIGPGGVPTAPIPTVPDIDWKALHDYLVDVAIRELTEQNSRHVSYTISPEAAVTYRREVEWWQHSINLIFDGDNAPTALETDGMFGMATAARTIDFKRFFRVGNSNNAIVGDKVRAAMIAVLQRKR